ncbi:hypothetical protein [uncultured Pediococcus sp.]|uniref:hypothetical protein n=1 Tax=uncultured Pediococcus sp. TaxID=165192 RepID=UPI00259AFCC3|nr:hypothetical protein [uncultured Pediococcus sp.]
MANGTATSDLMNKAVQLNSEADNYKIQANQLERNTQKIKSNLARQALETAGDLTGKLIEANINDNVNKSLNDFVIAKDNEDTLGTFNYVDMNAENGIEIDPDKQWANIEKWSADWVEKNVKDSRYKKRVQDAVNNYLVNTRRETMDSARQQDYVKLVRSTNQLVGSWSSADYNPDNDRDNILSLTATLGYDNIDKLSDVSDYNINKYYQTYVDERAKAEKGETNDSFTASKYLLFALNAKSQGMSQEQFTSFINGSSWNSEVMRPAYTANYIRTVCDITDENGLYGVWSKYNGNTDGLNEFINKETESIINYGIQTSDGKIINDLTEEELNNATKDLKSYATKKWNQISSEQDLMLSQSEPFVLDAIEKGQVFYSTDDEINYIKSLPGYENINESYAKSKIPQSRKVLYENNAYNKQVGDDFAIIIDPNTSLGEKTNAINRATSDGYFSFLKDDLGLGDLTTTKDDVSTDYTLALDKYLEENPESSYGEALAYLQSSTKISNASSAGSTSAVAPRMQAYISKAKAISDDDKANYIISVNEAIKNGSNLTNIIQNNTDTKYSTLNKSLQEITEDFNPKYLKLILKTEDDTSNLINAYLIINDNDYSASAKASAQKYIDTLKEGEENYSANDEIFSHIEPLLNGNASKEQIDDIKDYLRDNGLLAFFSESGGLGFGDLYDNSDNSSAYLSALNERIKNGESVEDAFLNIFGSYSVKDLADKYYSGSSYKEPQDVVNVRQSESYNFDNNKKAFASALLDSIKNGKDLDTELAEYSRDENVTAYKIVNKIAQNPNLVEAIQDDPGVTTFYDIWNATETIATSSSKEDINAAQKKLDNYTESARVKRDKPWVTLGYMIDNAYNYENTNGFSSEIIDVVEKGIINSYVDGLTSDGTDIRTALIRFADIVGNDSLAKKISDTPSRTVNNWDSDYIYSLFGDSVRTMATAKYGLYDGSQKTYMLDDNQNSTISDYIKNQANTMKISYSDELLNGLYLSGKLEFGKSYQGMKPSDNLLKTGQAGSKNYYSVLSDLAQAKDEAEKNSILREAKYYLTEETISEIQGFSGIDYLVRSSGLDGLNNFSFSDVMDNVLGSDSRLNEFKNDKQFTSFWAYIASDNATRKRINNILGEYSSTKNITAFNNSIEELANDIAWGYIAKNNKMYTASAYSDLIVDEFNPISFMDKSSNTSDNFYKKMSSNLQYYCKNADLGSYEITSKLDSVFNPKSSMKSTKSAEYLDYSLNESENLKGNKEVLFYLSWALKEQGAGLNITPEQLINDYSNTSKQIYEIMKKGDESEQTSTIKLAIGLKNRSDLMRKESDLGLGDTVSYNVDGELVSNKFGVISFADNGSVLGTVNGVQGVDLRIYAPSTSAKDVTKSLFGNDSTSNWFGSNASLKLSYWQSDSTDKVAEFNTSKESINGTPENYAKATNLIYYTNDLNIGAYSVTQNTEKMPDGYIGSKLEGSRIANLYKYYIDNNEESSADSLLSQLSPNMKKYVVEKYKQTEQPRTEKIVESTLKYVGSNNDTNREEVKSFISKNAEKKGDLEVIKSTLDRKHNNGDFATDLTDNYEDFINSILYDIKKEKGWL